jgi:DUF1365 family protein
MTHGLAPALYEGIVVHKRLRPVQHALRYRVFSLLLDCAELGALDRRLRLFSYNRFNVCSLYDADHGDGTSLQDYLAALALDAGYPEIERFLILCYPRMLGYGFNPVTVYFGLDRDDRPILIVYEVNNTFGERQSYAIPVHTTGEGATVSQDCPKTFYVSPFNTVNGRYMFHVTPLGDDLTLGIALEDDIGPILKAYFRGRRAPLSDRTLLGVLMRTGWLSVKVTAAIHFEALKLWLKGLRIKKRPPPPESAIAFLPRPRETETT